MNIIYGLKTLREVIYILLSDVLDMRCFVGKVLHWQFIIRDCRFVF